MVVGRWGLAYVRVSSMREAQALVPFPLYQPPGTIESISVRPETGDRWASVHSTVLFQDSRLRVKQVFVDPWGWYGRPANLVGEARRRCREYRGPRPFTANTFLGTRVGFYGCDYGGMEAGFIALPTRVEVRVLGRRLGAEAMARFYEDLRPADERASGYYMARPLPLWDWHMRIGSPGDALLSRFKWYLDPEAVGSDLGVKADIPRWLPGLRLDSVGLRLDDRRASLAAIYRAGGPDEVVSLVYAEDGSRVYDHPALSPESLDPGRFREEEVEVAGYSGVYGEASEYGEARLLVNAPTFRLAVLSGARAGHSPDQVIRAAEDFIEALSGQGPPGYLAKRL